MTKPKCKDCNFYQPLGTEKFGECRFDPPKVIGYSYQQDDRGPMTFFPDVRETHWCGKHKPKLFTPKKETSNE